CFDLLCEQNKDYIDTIFDPSTKVLAVEAASGLEWYKFANDVVRMKTFGASAPANELFRYFGFTAENIANKAKDLL
ncbi:MAG: transketolase-like TK C-terminal-containing protein, partial [Campylobacter hyointestinalis]